MNSAESQGTSSQGILNRYLQEGEACPGLGETVSWSVRSTLCPIDPPGGGVSRVLARPRRTHPEDHAEKSGLLPIGEEGPL